ncbi:MAG: extracellular matrix regulator RemB [bacterium]
MLTVFLHIGGNHLIRKSDIIGVFSVHSLTEDVKGRKFLADTLARKDIEDISEGKQTTIVLTDDRAYVSRISSVTLLQRGREDIGSSLSAPPRAGASG